MKPIPKILILSLLWCSCQREKNEPIHSINIVTIVDITDPQTILPDAEPILKLYGFDSDKSNAATFRITNVTDRQLNPALEFHLSDGTVTEKDNKEDDPYHREKLIVAFYETVRKAVTTFNSIHRNDSSLRHSECFSTICSELQLMQKRGASNNILLVFSDQQENSELFSCYTKANQLLLHKSPKEVARHLESFHLLPENLKGYTIFFVYQPKTREEDQKYLEMMTVYKMLLEPRGATVTIQASNNSYTL